MPETSPLFCFSILLNPVRALTLPVISFSWTAALSLAMIDLRCSRLRARISRVILSYTLLYRTRDAVVDSPKDGRLAGRVHGGEQGLRIVPGLRLRVIRQRSRNAGEVDPA